MDYVVGGRNVIMFPRHVALGTVGSIGRLGVRLRRVSMWQAWVSCVVLKLIVLMKGLCGTRNEYE